MIHQRIAAFLGALTVVLVLACIWTQGTSDGAVTWSDQLGMTAFVTGLLSLGFWVATLDKDGD